MKGRPKSIRRISSIPAVSGFRPYGDNLTSLKGEAVFLLYEEYEALRLSDYEKMNQVDSARRMGISRPTFTRIYMSAREKIAKAFVEGLRIIVEGGKVELDEHWYVCRDCGALFTLESDSGVCALCGSRSLEPYRLSDLPESAPASRPVKQERRRSQDGKKDGYDEYRMIKNIK